MTLKELAELQAQQTQDKAQTQKKIQAQEAQATDFKSLCLAEYKRIGNTGTATELRTIRALYDLYSLYSKYPPATDREWETIGELITIYTQDAGPELMHLAIKCFESLEHNAQQDT